MSEECSGYMRMKSCHYQIPRSNSQFAEISNEPCLYDTIKRPLPEIPDETLQDKRAPIINEILKTEISFLEDLKLCDRLKKALVKDTDIQSCGVNVEILFSNMEDIREVSAHLFRSMKENIDQKPPKKKRVGRCFLDNYIQIERVYSSYFVYYKKVEETLKDYQENMHIRRAIETSINTVKDDLQFLEFKSLLIKPVQRIGKYILFLKNLVEITEEDHIDKKDLIRALGTMEEVMKNLNEDQRFSEIGKVGKGNSGKKDNSLKKATHWISNKFKSTMKVATDDDKKFDEEIKKLYEMRKVIQILIKNLEEYLKTLQVTYDDQKTFTKTVSKFCEQNDDESIESIQIYQQIWTHASENSCLSFKSRIYKQVIDPLQLLIKIISNRPMTLIQERSKLLTTRKNITTKSPGESEENQKLLILNKKLLQDLPVLNHQTAEIFTTCVKHLVFLWKNFSEQIPRNLQNMIGSNQTDEAEFMQVFEQAHADAAEKQLSLDLCTSHGKIQRRTSLSTDDPPSPLVSPTSPRQLNIAHQSKNQREGITVVYEPSRLHTVKVDFRPRSQEETGLYCEELVAVLKKQDSNWFVDKGGETGYVPSVYLTPLVVTPEKLQGSQLFRAKWPFEAQEAQELNLNAGDVVRLIENCDIHGNRDWWFVAKTDKARGHCQGYVPSQYLTKYPN